MKRLTILTASLLALWVAPALALDMEFYTYGGFNSVANAFKQVALILNDSGFTGLFYVVTVLGILFGGIAFFLRLIGGMRLDPISWTWPILVGMVIYVAMIVPKGSLTIYDPVLNRFETVADIPDGVVLVAGTLNKLERGLVDIIDTAAPPTAKYVQGAGGIGFTALKNIMAADIKNSYFKQSLGRYMEDCVLFEMTRPGTTLSLDTLVNNNTDYLPELAKAVNPAVYTVYFTAATPNGAAMTCTDAWTNLNTFMLDVNNYTSAIAATAGKTMFDPDNAAEVLQFRGLVTDTMLETTGLATTPEIMVRQGLITRVLFETLQGSDPVLAMTVQANRQATTSGIGMMVAANEWLPVVKAVFTTVAIGLIPVLLLFIPTPLLGKSLSILVGFFLFLASWGVTDAIVHNAALAAAADTMKEISQSGLGLDACLSFPSASTKVLAMFGTIRSGGIMLASMLTMMLVSFGGHALSALAGNLTGQMQSAGVSAGALASPEGMSSARSGLVTAAGIEAWTNQHSFKEMAGADTFGRSMGVARHAAFEQSHEALSKSGQFSGSQKDMMRQSQASGSVVTEDGNVTYGSTPGSGLPYTRSDSGHSQSSVTQHGWQARSTSEGPGGQGKGHMELSNPGVGHLGFHGQDGNYELGSANIFNLSGKVGQSAQQVSLEKAAHSMGTSSNWNKMHSQGEKDVLSNTQGEAFREAVGNDFSQKWEKAVSDGSAYGMFKDQHTQNAIKTSLGASGHIGTADLLKFGGFDAKAGVSGEYSVVGSDGSKISFTADAREVEAFNRNLAHMREASVNSVLQRGEMRESALSASKSIGASDATSYINEAQSRKTLSSDQSMDMQAAYLKDYSQRNYGAVNEDSLQMSAGQINRLSVGNANDQSYLQNDFQNFLRDRYQPMGGGSIPAAIDEIRQSVGQQAAPIIRSGEAAAGQATRAVADNSYAQPNQPQPAGRIEQVAQRQGIELPDKNKVEDKYDKRAAAHNDVNEGNTAFTTNSLKNIANKLSSDAPPDARETAGKPGAQRGASGNWSGGGGERQQGSNDQEDLP